MTRLKGAWSRGVHERSIVPKMERGSVEIGVGRVKGELRDIMSGGNTARGITVRGIMTRGIMEARRGPGRSYSQENREGAQTQTHGSGFVLTHPCFRGQ